MSSTQKSGSATCSIEYRMPLCLGLADSGTNSDNFYHDNGTKNISRDAQLAGAASRDLRAGCWMPCWRLGYSECPCRSLPRVADSKLKCRSDDARLECTARRKMHACQSVRNAGVKYLDLTGRLPGYWGGCHGSIPEGSKIALHVAPRSKQRAAASCTRKRKRSPKRRRH